MFGSLGVPEMLFILGLALLVFGPKRLPELGRTIGRAMGELRRASTDLRRSLNNELTLEEESPRRPARAPSPPQGAPPTLAAPVPAAQAAPREAAPAETEAEVEAAAAVGAARAPGGADVEEPSRPVDGTARSTQDDAPVDDDPPPAAGPGPGSGSDPGGR